MNRKNTNIAIAAMLVAIAVSAAVFTMPTRQDLAWGFLGSTKVDQRINQLNNCTSQSPDNNYQQQSYDPNGDNKSSNDSSRGDSLNQATSDNHGNTNNQVSSGEDNSDKQPNSSNGDEKHNNHLVICINKANNLAQFG
jgi:uncharacterized protein YxeA